jgi:hypothetical protein
LFILGERKTSCYICCGLSAACVSEQINPHLENILSLATDVAGLPKTFEFKKKSHNLIIVHRNTHLIFSSSTFEMLKYNRKNNSVSIIFQAIVDFLDFCQTVSINFDFLNRDFD